MKFNKDKYVILGDVGDTGVLLSPGSKRTIETLKTDAPEVEEIFGAFCNQVINDCRKGYYLSKKINDTLVEDFKVQEKLNELLHEVNPTKGIMLLPTSRYNPFFNSFAYYVDKNQNSIDNELNFSLAFYGVRGIEIFISGTFIKKKFESLSFIADDLEFYIEKDLAFERFINYAFNILLFMQFAEIETVITEGKPSKGKSKVKFNNEKFLNESKIQIEIIDSNWFKRLIRTGAFKVKGHFRLQPYGTLNLLRKLIWIDDYTKNGYSLQPKILRNE